MDMNNSALPIVLLCAACGLARADLTGINYSTGDVFSISTADATPTRIGTTETGIMGLDRDPSGTLLTISDGLSGALGVLDEQTWQVGAVGTLGAGFTFEGGLAVGPAGELFGASRLAGGGRAIFQIDPATGGLMRSIVLSRASVDLNGLQFRGDGMLVAIDAVAGEFVSIDTSSGQVSTIAPLLSPTPGAVGGLASQDGMGYYITAGTISGSDGDNSLYSIDLFTGQQHHIGSLGGDAGAGFGIGALVGPPVPSPSGVIVLGAAGTLCMTRRRRGR